MKIMRKFADLHVRLSEPNDKILTRMRQVAQDMGITLIGVAMPQTFVASQISTIRDISAKIGVEVATRVDLVPKDRNHLLSDLRSVRKRFEIVAVTCRSNQIATVACRDRRVDLVSFPVNSRHSRFRRSLARLFREKSLEVDIARLVEPKELPRHVVFSRLRDQVSIAKTNRVSIVLSSGADNPLMLRGPREIAAIGMQLGLGDVEALESVSEIPFEIVQRNRAKLSPNHVTIGVKLTKVKKPVG